MRGLLWVVAISATLSLIISIVGYTDAARSLTPPQVSTEPASTAPGLYAEQVIEVDGTTVRRIRDTQGNTCYIATAVSESYGNIRIPAISCVTSK